MWGEGGGGEGRSGGGGRKSERGSRGWGCQQASKRASERDAFARSLPAGRPARAEGLARGERRGGGIKGPPSALPRQGRRPDLPCIRSGGASSRRDPSLLASAFLKASPILLAAWPAPAAFLASAAERRSFATRQTTAMTNRYVEILDMFLSLRYQQYKGRWSPATSPDCTALR